ncbi:hypothetical protein B0H13DRAFT_804179 [Mycena leptocephala]|nr:hypothetical protein B0H13DRAFT_804179 [Mycena leptocephala]
MWHAYLFSNHWYMALIYKPEYMVKSLPPVVETIIDVDALPDIEPRTYIFSLDSLGGANFWALEILSDYLKHEARDKLSKPLAGGPIPILRKARVPIQPNNYDCGLYALHVMQQSAGANPLAFARFFVIV